MRETLSLLNRHGIKLWFSTFLGGLVSICVLITFFAISIRMIAPSFFSRPVETLTALRTDALPQILTQVPPIWKTGLEILSALMLLLILFLLCGMMGSIREATLHDCFSVSHFFYYGMRYPVRILLMLLIHAILIGMTGWGVTQIAEVVPTGLGQIVVWIVGGLLLLGLAVATVHTPVISMVEKKGVFSAVGHSFRLLFLQGGTAILSLLYALILGTLGVTVLTMITVCPWFVLQFFGDQTIANIIGGGFGGLFFSLFHMIPTMIMISTLYTRYARLIRIKLFEDDTENEWLPEPTDSRPYGGGWSNRNRLGSRRPG
ncbi:hypothetical protein [Polycladomyces subterraneus]|uniref:G-protein coupled receptors family 1 profile domain-containing protein n=1 Tax=Polycladomyces subterraneus TaxID=1016997 RepID=A0ABT8IKD2_9BACL|nr:hypothetical protein [Polycladomyces subterraneus]MDN4592619.1 hypothetical protein [Polycladomyces subterraneus]